jgi:hypothetical protein
MHMLACIPSPSTHRRRHSFIPKPLLLRVFKAACVLVAIQGKDGAELNEYAFNLQVTAGQCMLPANLTALAITFSMLCVLYFLLYGFYIVDAFMTLYKLPFHRHRLENTFLR